MNLINLTKKAWQIRKAASARFGVKVMSISWKLCLEAAQEKPMTRLQKAAAYLEKMVADSIADADPADLAEVRVMINALRETQRTDLNKAVWASVLTCLKIKGVMMMPIASALEEAEGKEF